MLGNFICFPSTIYLAHHIFNISMMSWVTNCKLPFNLDLNGSTYYISAAVHFSRVRTYDVTHWTESSPRTATGCSGHDPISNYHRVQGHFLNYWCFGGLKISTHLWLFQEYLRTNRNLTHWWVDEDKNKHPLTVSFSWCTTPI